MYNDFGMQMHSWERIYMTGSVKNSLQEMRALYIRVSTDAQAEEGYSIQAQTERLEAYCKAMGWASYKLYIDGGYSGSNLNRPKITQLISECKKGKIKSVIVYKLDRLSRSQKDTLYLIEDVFMPNGVDFISLNESIDTSTPYGRAMIGILSAFAQLERENIFMRTRMGMLERIKKGYWMGGGKIPFGYSYDKNLGIIVPNEDAEKVRKIYDLYIQGYSAGKIAEMLELKYDKIVLQILARRSNLGIITYKGEEYPGQHQAIVSEETFNLAMAKMKERSSVRISNCKTYLLSGIVYCGHCGAKMRYMKWGKGVKLICYSTMKSKQYLVKDENCPAERVNAEDIENIVIADLFNVSANLDGKLKNESELFIDPLAEIEERVEQTRAKLKKLYNLYAESEDELLRETIDEHNKKLQKLQKELADEKKSNISKNHMEIVYEQLRGIEDVWEFLNDSEKHSIIRDCVEKVVIKDDEIEIYYRFLIKPNEQIAV